MARTAPTYVMGVDQDCVIEFLASHGRPDLVSVVVDQALTWAPTFRPGFDRGYQLAVDGAKRRVIVTRPHGAGKRPAVLLIGGIGCYSLDGLLRIEVDRHFSS